MDNVHGFSFQYPPEWKNYGFKDDFGPEGPGLSVNTYPLSECVGADEYVENYILPNYVGLTIRPITLGSSEGFIIKHTHLDYYKTPGPEAYIINCPYIIRLGFNPTGIENGEDVFNQILLSVKTWNPED